MRTVNIFTAKEVAQAFRRAGISVQDLAEPEYHVDGAVYIDDSRHVQVELHGGLVFVTEDSAHMLTFGPSRNTIAEIINDFHNPPQD